MRSSDDGSFLVYQFTSRVLPVLRQTFSAVRRHFERRNFPPAQVFECSGNPSGSWTSVSGESEKPR